MDVVKSGTSPLFSEEQEELSADHVQITAEEDYPYSMQETINLASDYACCLGLRDKDHSLSDRWLYNFLERWPELKLKKPLVVWKLQKPSVQPEKLLTTNSLNLTRLL